MALSPRTATFDLPEHRIGCSWSIELDFAELGADYLADLVEVQFWTRAGSKSGTLGLNLSLTGAGASDIGITIVGTVLTITPPAPITLNPGTHFWGLLLVWAGRTAEPAEGRWPIIATGAPTL